MTTTKENNHTATISLCFMGPISGHPSQTQQKQLTCWQEDPVNLMAAFPVPSASHVPLVLATLSSSKVWSCGPANGVKSLCQSPYSLKQTAYTTKDVALKIMGVSSLFSTLLCSCANSAASLIKLGTISRTLFSF